MRTLLVVGVASLLAVSLSPRRADACSVAGNGTHFVDETAGAGDEEPPQINGAPTTTLSDLGNPGCPGDSCGDLRTLSIDIESSDNSATDDKIGYLIELESGAVPIDIPLEAVSPSSAFEGHAQLVFIWQGERSSSGVLRITPIDQAGNLGAPVLITVEDSAGGACQAASLGMTSGSVAFALLFIAGLLAFRRRPLAR